MDTLKDLLKRYYRGETTLDEERFLKKEYRSGRLPEEPFLAFNRQEEPLPPALLSCIQAGLGKRRRKHIRQIALTIGSVAAMAVLILSLKGMLTPAPASDLRLTDNMKRERFENALRTVGNVLEDKKPSREKVLYEDNHLIIAIE